MRVSVIGSGYVGTTAAACFADAGHEVVNVDIDDEVAASINDGVAPIREEGLDALIAEYGGDLLRATSDHSQIVETELTFLCLPTPSRDDGSVDLSAIETGAESVGKALGERDDYHVVAVKSTIPPGTTDEVIAPAVRSDGANVGVASNPEFLREGSAVADFRNPGKIVVGSSDERARKPVLEAYEPFVGDDVHVFETGTREAEMVKYANNAFLATKVSLVNEIGNICKELGVGAYEVMEAVGLDHRISSEFMRSGLGWGGSCFPKDVDALRAVADGVGYDTPLLDAAVEVNDLQPVRAVELLEEHIDLEGATVAVLGLAFKPGTDDVRNSRALDLVRLLDGRGADMVACDPEPRAVENAREVLGDVVMEYTETLEEAVGSADGIVVATDWEEFEGFDASGKVVVDGRRILVENTEEYEGLCW